MYVEQKRPHCESHFGKVNHATLWCHLSTPHHTTPHHSTSHNSTPQCGVTTPHHSTPQLPPAVLSAPHHHNERCATSYNVVMWGTSNVAHIACGTARSHITFYHVFLTSHINATLKLFLNLFRRKFWNLFCRQFILVEIRSWRNRNLKFGPNCDLEVDDLGQILNSDSASSYFPFNTPNLDKLDNLE